MSYILEALKKSEQEREQGAVPDIKSVHKPEIPGLRDVKGRWWLWLLIAVIIINGGVFAVVYFGEDDAASVTPTAQQSQAIQQKQIETVAKAKIPQPSTQSATTSRSSTQSEQQSPKTKEPVEQAPRSKVVFSDEPLQLSDSVGNPVANEKDSTTTQTETSVEKKSVESQGPAGLVSELPESVRKQIPSIQFGGHVYSSKVKRRSVMINGKKMREGEAVGSGLLLTKITPQGAEFEFQGYRFRLNALQDWSYR